MLMEFESQAKCAEYINYDKGEISRAIRNQTLIKKTYYVSNELVDEFKPSPRKTYIDKTFYVYTSNEFVGEFKGKEIMNKFKLSRRYRFMLMDTDEVMAVIISQAI